MRDRLGELGSDTELALITFTTASLIAGYQQNHDIPFPLLIDPSRSTYRAYGLGRGSVFRVWGLRAAKNYVEILRRDGVSGLRRPTEDTLQLGGDFVIAPDGRLAWGHWGEGPDDRPAIDDLVAAVEAANGG